MCAFRLTVSRRSRRALERQLNTAHQVGQWHDVQCLLAILALTEGQSCEQVAVTRRVTPETVHQGVHRFLVAGLNGLRRKQPPGRPPQLTKTQTPILAALLDEGPGQAGFASACWRSPMMQPVIHERLGGYDHVFSIAPLLKHLGSSDQKAALVSDHLHDAKRQEWCNTTWPQMLTVANAKSAWLVCGDAASCPQWGTLSYTGARRGHQPVVKTSGKRTGVKGFGLIDDFTGRCCYQGHEGRLNSESYSALRARVLEQTTQHLRLIQDGASDHPSAARQACFAHHTARLQVFPLPRYSPDDHPLEKLWKKIQKAGTHLHDFPTFEALKEKVEQTLVPCEHTPAEILALCSLPTELAKVASVRLLRKSFS
jgi:transposase